MTFGEAGAGRVDQQVVVTVSRGRQVEQGLEQPMHIGRGEQIHSACDQRDALERVVDGDREVIAGGGFLARQHHVPLPLRPGRLDTVPVIGPGEGAGAFERLRNP